MEGKSPPVDIEKLRRRLSAESGEGRMLSTAELLRLRPELANKLRRKPVRSASGIVPVAVMSSPAPCPHGRCIPCPGGPGSNYDSPQSYTGFEPAAARAMRHDYQPYEQALSRIEQLSSCGHSTGKVELIIMGGTFTARELEYQKWFVGECFRAMNEAGQKRDGKRSLPEIDGSGGALKRLQRENEGAPARCVAMTLETRPDYCSQDEIDVMLNLGATKVELGVQCLNDGVLESIQRGHGVSAVKESTARLRDTGFKVGYHLMPGLPGVNHKDDVESARRVFEDPAFCPDYLKLYPTLVVEGSPLAELWREGEFVPLNTEQAIRIVAEIKAMIPPWIRLSRVQRDIPLKHILAGVDRANLRELAMKELDRRDVKCHCIRCREPGRRPGTASALKIKDLVKGDIEYEAAGSIEHFLSLESEPHDMLIGFLRLRFPAMPHRPELSNAAIVRELHVYGTALMPGAKPAEGDWQHRGLGKTLISWAEQITKRAGYGRLAVLSGVGARSYYRKLEFCQEGPYMVKGL